MVVCFVYFLLLLFLGLWQFFWIQGEQHSLFILRPEITVGVKGRLIFSCTTHILSVFLELFLGIEGKKSVQLVLKIFSFCFLGAQLGLPRVKKAT